MLINRKIPFRYIFNKIKENLLYVIIIGVVVKYLTVTFFDYIPRMPIAIPTFIGTAISVLLSFKLNQSYDRWWEARKIWGAIVNDSRSLVVQLQSFVPATNKVLIERIALRHVGWCYSLGQNLRGLDPLDNLKDLVSDEDIARLSKHSNVPLALLQQGAGDIERLKAEGALSEYYHVQLNTTFVRFSDAMGMAERIKSTIFPITYRLFLHLLIYVFVVTLSISLGEINSIYEIPLLMVLASCFFLLERTATHMQDPFSNGVHDTAMTTIARTIHINVYDLLQKENPPKPFPPMEFYRM